MNSNELFFSFPGTPEMITGRKKYVRPVSIITGGNYAGTTINPALLVQSNTGGPALMVFGKASVEILRIGIIDGNTSIYNNNYISFTMAITGNVTVSGAFGGGGTGVFFNMALSSATFVTTGTTGPLLLMNGPTPTGNSNLIFAGASSVFVTFASNPSNVNQTTPGVHFANGIFAKVPFSTGSSGATMAANLVIQPLGAQTIAGTGTTSDTASLYIVGAAAATVSGKNYALWVDADRVRIDDNIAAPSTTPGVVITNFYGSAATNFLGDPNLWLRMNVNGTDYKIPLYS